MEKSELRKQFRGAVADMRPEGRADASRSIVSRLIHSKEYDDAGIVFAYLATPTEVDTRGFIEAAWTDGKRVAVPRLEADRIIAEEITPQTRLVPGPYSILQPSIASPTVDVIDIDLIVVPGVAFTSSGVRLGRGGGHFDRWLGTLPPDIPVVGLAFACQIASHLPREPHDIAVSRVITEAA